MNQEFLSEDQARELVTQYMEKTSNKEPVLLQDILDSGTIPELKGFVAKPGKVSSSIFGGRFIHDGIEHENPPLQLFKKEKPLRIMVRSMGISTHDIKRGYIPFKDQILAENHNFMLWLVKNFIGTSQFNIGLPRNSVVIASENLQTILFENVMRRYMAKTTTATSLYQAYISGKREFCGNSLPNDLIANGKLPELIHTPSTKSDTHDESVSPEELSKLGICKIEQYNEIKEASSLAFLAASEYLAKKGVILVDTKLEHGINSCGEIVSQDEIFTMDSSRFWLLEDYQFQIQQYEEGKIKEINPKSFSKEFARGMSQGENGYTDEQKVEIAVRYILGIQYLLGKPFEPDMRSWEERVVHGLKTAVKTLYQ